MEVICILFARNFSFLLETADTSTQSGFEISQLDEPQSVLISSLVLLTVWTPVMLISPEPVIILVCCALRSVVRGYFLYTLEQYFHSVCCSFAVVAVFSTCRLWSNTPIQFVARLLLFSVLAFLWCFVGLFHFSVPVCSARCRDTL